MPLADRFWPKVAVAGPDDCWEWTGSRYTNGYGMIRPGGRASYVGAHRVAYELQVGPIPDGLTIDHLCKNRGCVNPSHLEPVSMQENLLRSNGASGVNARKATCPQGHPYSHVDSEGRRRCRECVRERDRRRKRRRR